MYLICYYRLDPNLTNTYLMVAKAVRKVEEITEFMNEHRYDDQEYIVLTATIYPEKR